MSTRTRSRPRPNSYTARLQDRAAARRRRRAWPAWLTSRQPPALLAVLVELAHLVTALTEWPASPLRGLVHVLAAAGFGLTATGVYFGPTRPAAALGLSLALSLPAAWLVGGLAGNSPYRDYPPAATAILTVAEAGLAVLLAARWRATVPPPPNRRGHG